MKKSGTKLTKTFKKVVISIFSNKTNIFAGLLICVFSIYIMFSTFSYKDGSYVIANKIWSDFMNHIPLIRSFSYGYNFPPEFPLYAYEPMRYHFVFYMLVGFLEKFGIRMDIGLNILSAGGMIGMLIAIYKLAIKIFKTKFAGLLSILLVILNPTLNVIYYFFIGSKKLDQFKDLFTAKVYGAFGPYDDNIIQAFWNWNIWTNQRHLAFSIMLAFVAVWLILYSKKWYGWIVGALIIGLMAWLHKAILMVLLIILLAHLFVGKINKTNLLKALILGVLLSMFGIIHLNSSGTSIRIALGYAYNGTSWWEFPNVTSANEKWILFWLMNMGFLPIYAVFGFITYIISHPIAQAGRHRLVNIYNRLVNRFTIWFYIAVVIFIVANIFVFSVDINANHKLFNIVIIIFSVYAAGFIYYIFKEFKLLFLVFLFPMILGGILDIFPFINDDRTNMADIQSDNLAIWMTKNTTADDVVFNLSGSTSSATIAGRKIYYGPEYFTWSNGYNIDVRAKKIVEFIGMTDNHEFVCDFLRKERLDLIWAMNNDEEKFRETQIKISELKEHMYFDPELPDRYLIVFSTDNSCK